MSAKMAPLAGVRVLDASRVLAGPFCGQLLGDLGAEVLKVERPDGGDETRSWGPPFVGEQSAYFLSCNRNKLGLAIDLSQHAGRHLLHALARRSDVLLENFRPGSAERLGLDPESLLRINPRLVIASLSGFGRTGPWRDRPGYDLAIQALSGLMSITGPAQGPPCKVGVAVTDVLTGLYAATAVLACLRAREKSGHGYVIDLALLDCAVAAQVNIAQAYLSAGEVPPRQGNAHLQIVPYQAFATADDWLVLAVGNDGQWQRFCRAAGRPDLAAEPRFASNAQRVQHRAALVPMLEALFKSRPTDEWERLLRQAEVPHAPVWDHARLFGSAQAQARGLRVTVRDAQGRPVELVGCPLHIAGADLSEMTAPPGLGQDTAAVLARLLDLPADALAQLRADGVIA